MIKYFKMKKLETEMKYRFYSLFATISNENDKLLKLIGNLYLALKDVPIEELRTELIKQMAVLIHDETHNQQVTFNEEENV